jgi:DNA (cytosine-5)-methyltransferase 1
MKKNINIIELFSGIGGFSLGLDRAGFNIKKHYYSDIDKYAIANFKYNFKNAKYIGSVETIQGEKYKNIDIITFGSPCQDFSISGKRKGLTGEKSSLIREAIRIVNEVRPSVFIWENVKGAFSSNNGADFWAIINAFANIGEYRLEWQLLNTSWLLPQNRERIYFIGHLTGKSKPGIFPFTENDKIFARKERTEKKQFQTKFCTTVTNKVGMRATSTFVHVPNKAGAITAGAKSGGLHSDMLTLEVRSANKAGYELANIGDGINISNINSKTKRGRVGKGMINTLTCKCDYLAVTEKNIRRLTNIETERLQGFPDNWTLYGAFNGEKKQISNTQRFKLVGNAVTVDIVEMIGKRLRKNK